MVCGLAFHHFNLSAEMLAVDDSIVFDNINYCLLLPLLGRARNEAALLGADMDEMFNYYMGV